MERQGRIFCIQLPLTPSTLQTQHGTDMGKGARRCPWTDQQRQSKTSWAWLQEAHVPAVDASKLRFQFCKEGRRAGELFLKIQACDFPKTVKVGEGTAVSPWGSVNPRPQKQRPVHLQITPLSLPAARETQNLEASVHPFWIHPTQVGFNATLISHLTIHFYSQTADRKAVLRLPSESPSVSPWEREETKPFEGKRTCPQRCRAGTVREPP